MAYICSREPMSFTNDIEEHIYQEYLSIDVKAYQSKIRFYEYNKKAIRMLPYKQRLEISLEYVVSLFEVGEYYEYLEHVDKLLEKVIEDNIFSIAGDDIYQELLYRKGASYYNVLDFVKADHVLGQLCRINKKNELYKKTYYRNKIDYLRYQGQKVRASIIGLLLMTGLIIGVELLFIRTIFRDHIQAVEILRTVLFGTAVLGIIIQEARIRYSTYKQHKELIK